MVVLLLFINCLMFLLLFVRVLFLVLALLCITLSSFAIILTRKGELDAFLMSCDCLCSVALPHGALGYCLFGYFVAFRPKSTAMVMAGQSFHLTTLLPGQA